MIERRAPLTIYALFDAMEAYTVAAREYPKRLLVNEWDLREMAGRQATPDMALLLFDRAEVQGAVLFGMTIDLACERGRWSVGPAVLR